MHERREKSVNFHSKDINYYIMYYIVYLLNGNTHFLHVWHADPVLSEYWKKCMKR